MVAVWGEVAVSGIRFFANTVGAGMGFFAGIGFLVFRVEILEILTAVIG